MEIANYIDIKTIREEFPILQRQVNGYPLVYLDNAATTQKPKAVIDAVIDYYSGYNANIHRGVHHLANIATEAYENARSSVKYLVNARDTAEIIFTSGTTDSINLVAQSWGRQHLRTGDEIVISAMEHHSNIVPWQMIAKEKNAVIKVIPVTNSGEWNLEDVDQIFSKRTKIVAVNHVSNSLGTINPVKELSKLAKRHNAMLLIDGAQAISHLKVDVQELDCDFYCFSGHKMYATTGTGILYGKAAILETMPPYRGGGEMISNVTFAETTYNVLPYKFEAGTPNIEGVIALGAAIKFLNEIGIENSAQWENELLFYTTEKLNKIPGLKVFGTSVDKVPVISFNVGNIHPYDLGTLLDKQGIAVRTGHHCTQPLWDQFGVPGSVRASFAMYNTIEECDQFLIALEKSLKMLK